MMTDFIHFLAVWTLFGAACSTWMFLREALRQRRPAVIRARSERLYPRA
jgi:hypothetical protein